MDRHCAIDVVEGDGRANFSASFDLEARFFLDGTKRVPLVGSADGRRRRQPAHKRCEYTKREHNPGPVDWQTSHGLVLTTR